MDLRVLGALEIWHDDGPVFLRAAKPRQLLTILASRPDEPSPPDVLIDELWEGHPPTTAASALRTHVTQVRRALEPDRSEGPSARLPLSPSGYVLRVAPSELDSCRFEALVIAACDANELGDPAAAARGLDDALALWRGPPLVDAHGLSAVTSEIARLEQLHVRAIEQLAEARLALGEHAALVNLLLDAVSAHPLNETFAAQLMLALYRSGRQAEALRVYGRLGDQLDQQLAIEPSEPPAAARVRHPRSEPTPRSFGAGAEPVDARAVGTAGPAARRSPGRVASARRCGATSGGRRTNARRRVGPVGHRQDDGRLGVLHPGAAVSAPPCSSARATKRTPVPRPSLRYSAPSRASSTRMAAPKWPGSAGPRAKVTQPPGASATTSRVNSCGGYRRSQLRSGRSVTVRSCCSWKTSTGRAAPRCSSCATLLRLSDVDKLLVVATVRDEDLDAEQAQLITDLAPAARTQVVPLAGLSDHEVRALIKTSATPRDVLVDLAPNIREATDGNPLFIRVLLRDLTDAPTDDRRTLTKRIATAAPDGVRR